MAVEGFDSGGTRFVVGRVLALMKLMRELFELGTPVLGDGG